MKPEKGRKRERIKERLDLIVVGVGVKIEVT